MHSEKAIKERSPTLKPALKITDTDYRAIMQWENEGGRVPDIDVVFEIEPDEPRETQTPTIRSKREPARRVCS